MSSPEEQIDSEGILEKRELDPVTLQVIGGEFDTIAEEMGNKMKRSSYSSVIRENEDIGAGIFTTDCEEIAESDYTPMHVGTLPAYLEGMYRAIEERGDTVEEVVNEGDVFFHNQTYYGASHSSDVGVCVPIFYEDEFIGWSATTSHVLDIGMATPGLGIDLYDMYGEGELFKARKVISEGERNEEIWNHIRDNTRTPDMNEGDLQALIAACRVGKQRYLELIDEYGLETVEQAGEDLMDYAEALLRKEIEKLPDGTWDATGYLDDDGVNRGKKLKIHVEVTIDGDEMTIDLTDSADQVPTAFNSPREGSTKVAAYFTLRSLLMDTYTHDEYIPQNTGTFRPINVETRKGSIFDPAPPAAAYARINQVDLMSDLILKALRDVAPDRIMAGTSASVFVNILSGPDPDSEGDYWMFFMVGEGSYGGRPNEDGVDSVGAMIHNTRNSPAEDVELRHPLRVDRYELREDEHGAGEHRGGHGCVREITPLVETGVTVEGDGESNTPWGAFGGGDGDGATLWRLRTEDDEASPEMYSDRRLAPDEMDFDDGVEVEKLPTMFSTQEFAAGDRYVLRTPMSGGYGDPTDRPIDKVYNDYLDDLIDDEIAREEYGVVIEDGELDREASEKRRQQ